MNNEQECYDDFTPGKDYLVDLTTGEAIEAITVTVPVGTKFYTPKQQQWYEKRQQLLEEARMKKAMIAMNRDELGHFFFASTDNDYERLTPATTARLLFLCTYLQRYDTDVLYLRKRTPLQYRDLPKVLGLSRGTVSSFVSETSSFLSILDDGCLRINSDSFHRGSLPKRQHTGFQRIYISSVRKLYHSVPKNKHRYLGYVFLMLPYLNIEHNILCNNPEEHDLKCIDAISFPDFCQTINYDVSNASRLQKEYEKITFPVNGTNEKFCSFVCDVNNPNKTVICVNPHIVYSGKDYSHVEILGAFCNTDL